LAIQSVHNEAILLTGVAKGDEKAFAELFYAYYNQLAEYVLKIIDSPEIAADIVQDVFVKVWTLRHELDRIDNFSGYLFILTRNYTYNCLKKIARDRKREQRYAQEAGEPEPEAAATEQQEHLSLVERAVAQLPAQQQKAYVLSRQQGLKHKEIALQMGISPETVKKHLQLALKAITEFVKLHATVLALLLIRNQY
jgi:RNA polymerase sigma-70 factor (family 1)